MTIENVKKLREETGAGVLDTQKALEEAGGDFEQAKKILFDRGRAKAAQKTSERTTNDGLVYSYIHNGGKSGSLVLVACETDFVANTEDFKELCHAIAMQVCAGEYGSVPELMEDEYIKDPSKKVADLVSEVIAKTGEKIEVLDFAKLSI